jgi:hypothetical protein
LKFLGLWNDNKLNHFETCGIWLCVNMVPCFEAFGFWFYVILPSKLQSRCSLLKPCCKIQNGYKISIVDVDCQILECNRHFCENMIKQTNCCVTTTCTSVIRFKFMTFTHAPSMLTIPWSNITWVLNYFHLVLTSFIIACELNVVV